jgi:glycosyltransferase involved in cell wall biosynthesis
VQDLVVVTRIFSGIESAIDSGHWTHSGSPAYYHFIRKLDSNNKLKCKLFFLSPNIIGKNKKKDILFDNIDIVGKFIPYYPFPFSSHIPVFKKIEFFYNKFRQYILILSETSSSRCYYIDRDNILLSFVLLVMSRSNVVITRLLGVTESLYMHLTNRGNIYSKIIRWTFGNDKSYFICTNDGSYAELTKNNLGYSNFYLLFNGVDKGILSTLKPNNNNFDGKIVISYISRIVPNKGHINFINSLRKVSNHDNLIVYIVGDGALKGQCQDLVCKYMLDSFVFFTGGLRHKNAMHYLSMSDLFVYINFDGSFGNSVLEASQFGLPIVTLLHKSLPLDKYPFFKFIKNNHEIEENITSFIENFIDNKQLRKSMSESSIDFYNSYLVSWDDRINTEIDIINSICASNN